MMASSRDRTRSSPWDGIGFGRIGCLLHQAEEHAIMNRAETEDCSYTSARNRKLLAEGASKAGESEYAEPALNPCQTTAFEFFTDDELASTPRISVLELTRPREPCREAQVRKRLRSMRWRSGDWCGRERLC